MFAPTSNMFTPENQVEMLGRLTNTRPRRGTGSRRSELERSAWQQRWLMRAIKVTLVLVTVVLLVWFLVRATD
jgi:hypothetical protein